LRQVGSTRFVLAAAAAAALSLSAQSEPVRRSVRDGVFTAAQADRGLAAYERSCSKCHQSDLRGDPVSEAPPLVGEMFLANWSDQPVKDVFDKVRTRMPADKPGSLTPATALDIVAYLLKSNGFPSGSGELTLDGEGLTRIITAVK
jgi:mono/diheme cytochrome c family protein